MDEENNYIDLDGDGGEELISDEILEEIPEGMMDEFFNE